MLTLAKAGFYDFFYRLIEPCYVPDTGERLICERTYQHAACSVVRYAACAHVEQRFFVQTSYRSPMGATYVVGIDFQLRVGFDAGVGREQYVVVLLVCFDLLCMFLHGYFSVENSAGMSVGDVAECLETLAQRAGMEKADAVYDRFVSLGDSKPV